MVAIIDAKAALEATPRILDTHRIPHSKSSDLRRVDSTTVTDAVLEKERQEKVENEEDEEDEDFEEVIEVNQVKTT